MYAHGPNLKLKSNKRRETMMEDSEGKEATYGVLKQNPGERSEPEKPQQINDEQQAEIKSYLASLSPAEVDYLKECLAEHESSMNEEVEEEV